MLIIPSMKRNSFLSDLENLFPITAICPLLNAGKNKLSGEKTAEAKIGLNFFILTSSLAFCRSIFVFVFMLRRTLDIPNNPVRRGTNGSLSSRFKTIRPRTPDNKKAKSAENFLFSVKTTFKETKINTIGIIFWLIPESEKVFVIKDKGKIIKTKIKSPIKQPSDVRCTA